LEPTMYMLPSGLTAAPNNDSQGGAERRTCPSVAPLARMVPIPNSSIPTLKRIPICVFVRLRFKFSLPDCGLYGCAST
jgi:hypothetical protein